MNKYKIDLMKLQVKILKSAQLEYGCKTIDTIISNIESRLKYYKEL